MRLSQGQKENKSKNVLEGNLSYADGFAVRDVLVLHLEVKVLFWIDTLQPRARGKHSHDNARKGQQGGGEI